MATAVTTTVIVEERENEEILKTQIIDSSRFIRAYRPWHSLYGVRLRLQTASQVRSSLRNYYFTSFHRCRNLFYLLLAAAGTFVAPKAVISIIIIVRTQPHFFKNIFHQLQEPEKELSLIQKLLPNEILALVFARLPITSLGKASMVDRFF